MLFLRWPFRYDHGDAVMDLVSGITVGLVTVSQGVVLAVLLDLPLQNVMWSSLLGCLLYPLLGSGKEVNIGITPFLAALTSVYIFGDEREVEYKLAFSSFVCGAVILIAAIALTGHLWDRLSSYVLAGFVWSQVLIVASTEIYHTLGLNPDYFEWYKLPKLIYRIKEARPWDFALSSCCISIIVFLRIIALHVRSIPDTNSPAVCQKLTKPLFYLSYISSAVVLLVSTIIAYCLTSEDYSFFTLIGHKDYDFQLPTFTIPKLFSPMSYDVENWRSYLSLLTSVPIISMISHLAVIRAFSNGEDGNTNKELLALGTINLMGSCIGCVPVTADFARSSVSSFCGVRSRMASLYAGILVSLYFVKEVMPFYSYIPQAAVSSVVLCTLGKLAVSITLAAHSEGRKIRGVAGLVTCFIGLGYNLEIGVILGIIIDVILCTCFKCEDPVIVQNIKDTSGSEYILLTPSPNVKVPTIQMCQDALAKSADMKDEIPRYVPVVVDFKHITFANLSVTHGAFLLIEYFNKRKTDVIFHRCNPEVAEAFTNLFPQEFLCSTTERQLRKHLEGLHSIMGRSSALKVTEWDLRRSSKQSEDNIIGDTNC